MADEISDALETNATDGFAEVEGDAGRVKQHPLPDQIAADQYVNAKAGASKKWRGLRVNKIIQPGHTGTASETT